MAQRGTTQDARRGTPTGSTPAGAWPNSNGPRQSSRRVTPGASQRFVAATEQRDGLAPVVSVMGEVDLATALALEQTLLGAVEDGKGEVIVDLTGCSFLDSRGLRALIATRARLERSNRRLVLVLSNPSVLRIFQITRRDRLFDIYPSLRAAVRPAAAATATRRECETPAW
jgi:anti-sigma B factor antagonist